MKQLILLGIAFAASQAFGQSVDERSAPQMLCTPFASQATDLLHLLDSGAERSYSPESDETQRRVANAIVGCAGSAVRLWSRPEADAELATIERRFEMGTATSMEVVAARVAVAKATYCEAAFSNYIGLAEQFERRKMVGLVGVTDITLLKL